MASDDVQMEQINVRLEQQSMLDPDERQAEAAAAHERVSRASSTSNRRAPSKDDSLSSTHTQSAVTETRVDDTDTDSLATSNGSKRASVILAGVTTRSSSSDMSPVGVGNVCVFPLFFSGTPPLSLPAPSPLLDPLTTG